MPYSHLTGAVISSDEISDHDYEMAQKSVAVRDGDASIEIGFADDNETHIQEDDGRVEIKLNTETGEVEGESDDGEVVQHEDLPEFDDNASPAQMTETASMLQQAEAGQADVLSKALEGGCTQEQLDAMRDHYEQHESLTDEHYAALEAAGLSKAYVNSFMAGQIAVGEKFANSVLDYVGGKANFEKLAKFMGENHGDMADAFNAALERYDVTTIKALLDNGKTLMRAHYGSRPARSLTNAAKPAATAKAAPAVEGFKSRQEMVAAMSDKRYERDAAYRREVELKVFHSQF